MVEGEEEPHHGWSDPHAQHKTGVDRVPHKSINSSLDKLSFWSLPSSAGQQGSKEGDNH